WTLATVYYRSRRWHDVRRVLGPLTALTTSDEFLRQAVTVAYGTAGAYLGLWEQALGLLAEQGRGPIAAATAEALLVAGLCARALNRGEVATELLNEAYAVTGLDASVRERVAEAL